MGKETSNTVRIRKATVKDVPYIYQIGTLCFSDAWLENTICDDLEKSHSEYFIVEIQNIVVGYSCFWYILDEAQLVNIGVHPDYRRKGIGELLLKEGIAEASKKKMKTLFLEVRVTNLPAQALYRKYGLKVVSLRKNVYSSPMEDGYIMTCKL